MILGHFRRVSVECRYVTCLLRWLFRGSIKCALQGEKSVQSGVLNIFNRLDVLLDHLAPRQGVFPYALDWAACLQVPVHGIGIRPLSFHCDPQHSGETTSLPGVAANSGLRTATIDLSPACAEVCAELQVPWQYSELRGDTASALRQAVLATDLLALGQALPLIPKRDVLRNMMHECGPAVLVCPHSWVRVSRALVLDLSKNPNLDYLIAASALCRKVNSKAIVLTVDRSMHAANQRQQLVRRTLTDRGLQAEFDLLVGFEVRHAVASVARWRRCQLVILERRANRPWWRWLSAVSNAWPIEPTEDVAYLSLPQSRIRGIATAAVSVLGLRNSSSREGLIGS
jgi:hypothetical protein